MEDILNIVPTNNGKFLHTYNLELSSGRNYEMVSRRPLHDMQDFHKQKPDAVTILAFDHDRSHILVNWEYRFPVGKQIYNLPAGLIDPNETIEEAATRELFEETGCKMVKMIDVLGLSYQSAGMSNESSVVFICEAEGQPTANNKEDTEDITPMWLSMNNAEALLEEETPISSRLQMLLWCWARTDELFCV